MSTFSDYFSSSAELYARYRPRYPAALFKWIAQHSPDRHRAWDCGTGSGQAAVELAMHFDEVIATDPSYAQLQQAEPGRRVHYGAMTAEHAAIRDASVDTVTVAQALHWFNRPHFYDEVNTWRPDRRLELWAAGHRTGDRRSCERIP